MSNDWSGATIAGRKNHSQKPLDLLYRKRHKHHRSRLEHDRVVTEWLANGYYHKNGKSTASVDGIKIALRFLCQAYGRTPADDFGPLALAAFRNTMIEPGDSRV